MKLVQKNKKINKKVLEADILTNCSKSAVNTFYLNNNIQLCLLAEIYSINNFITKIKTAVYDKN